VTAAYHASIDELAGDPGSNQRDRIQSVRDRLAQFVNVDPGELALTRSTTEGMNIFAHGLGWKPDDEVIIGTHEHFGGLQPYQTLRDRFGIKIVSIDSPVQAATNGQSVTIRYASAVIAALLVPIGAVAADPAPDRGGRQDIVFGSPDRFDEQGGESIYRHVCAGCHMPDGKGAAGAGAYPALAEDEQLAAAGYPVVTVLYGRKAMPPLGRYLSDSQIAEVPTPARQGRRVRTCLGSARLGWRCRTGHQKFGSPTGSRPGS